MKKVIGLFLVCFLVVSCNKDVIKKERNLDEFAERMEVRKIKGTITFRDHNCNRFFISTYINGTIDSKILAIPDNMPVAFQQDGLEVKYSGLHEKMDSSICSWIGGESEYRLIEFKIEEK